MALRRGGGLALWAVVLLLTERPLSASGVEPERDVALRIYRLGTVEVRILGRVAFEVGQPSLGWPPDAGELDGSRIWRSAT